MSVLPPKPREGAPCNGCGLCCVAETCSLALLVNSDLKINEPCPYLEYGERRTWCGLVRRPSHHLGGETKPDVDGKLGPEIRAALGDGTCDASAPEGLTVGVWLAFHG